MKNKIAYSLAINGAVAGEVVIADGLPCTINQQWLRHFIGLVLSRNRNFRGRI